MRRVHCIDILDPGHSILLGLGGLCPSWKDWKGEFDAQSDDGENVGFREENAQDPDSKYSGPKHSPAEYDSVLIRVICRLLAVNTHYQVVRATCRVSHTDSEENIAILSQL